jgi:integrase
MGRTNKIRGLTKRGALWHINKVIRGRRIYESTGTSDLCEAERYLARRIEEIRQADVYGVRPRRTFQQAAIKYLKENQHKRSIQSDAYRLKIVVSHIGDLPLEYISMSSLQAFIQARQQAGKKSRTINHGLAVVRRICNLAATEWVDDCGLTWLLKAPKIRLLPEKDSREPRTLNWEEQDLFFSRLPAHLRAMALFKVNTGCRDKEVCQLRWEWEYLIPQINTTVFIIPGAYVKNGEDRLVILNPIARDVIANQRGQHPEFVFTYRGKPIDRMTNSAWKQTRKTTGIYLRVHDLKHTFGARLRAAGVSFEDRQDLLGHKSRSITTHYSSAQIESLIDAANRVCDRIASSPALRLVKLHSSRVKLA